MMRARCRKNFSQGQRHFRFTFNNCWNIVQGVINASSVTTPSPLWNPVKNDRSIARFIDSGRPADVTQSRSLPTKKVCGTPQLRGADGTSKHHTTESKTIPSWGNHSFSIAFNCNARVTWTTPDWTTTTDRCAKLSHDTWPPLLNTPFFGSATKKHKIENCHGIAWRFLNTCEHWNMKWAIKFAEIMGPSLQGRDPCLPSWRTQWTSKMRFQQQKVRTLQRCMLGEVAFIFRRQLLLWSKVGFQQQNGGRNAAISLRTQGEDDSTYLWLWIFWWAKVTVWLVDFPTLSPVNTKQDFLLRTYFHQPDGRICSRSKVWSVSMLPSSCNCEKSWSKSTPAF